MKRAVAGRVVVRAIALALMCAGAAEARDATLRLKARLRDGPGKETSLVGWVDAGVTVEIVGEVGGWRQVQIPDGRTGYIWREHFLPEGEVAPPSTAAAPAVAPAPSPVPTRVDPQPSQAAGDDLRTLRAEVEALRQRSDGPTTAEVAALRAEIGRLTTAQQQIERRLDERTVPIVPVPASSTTTDATAGAAALFLAVGGAIGWVGSRIAQRLRDRRQRIRI